LPQIRLANVKSKTPLETKFASGPLILTFALLAAAGGMRMLESDH
jgi:hypothetical protein